ncbi:hypothetical protein LZL87_010047 [Fusarium oxysporum]|nr:hypothetical protein LZL87_010047 [Fusarium oxysporum]
MPSAQHIREDAFGSSTTNLDYDVLIIGARLSGILSLYRMREHGLKTKVIEAGSGEGGTWFCPAGTDILGPTLTQRVTPTSFPPQKKFLMNRTGQNISLLNPKLFGILNKPTLPSIPSISNFKGQAWHTARQPNDACALNGKRVGIISTGATAIQTI